MEEYAIGAVAIIAILGVTFMVIGLAPGSETAPPYPAPLVGDALTGQVVSAPADTIAVRDPAITIDLSRFDYNGDGLLDFYDYQDILAGRVDCNAQDCDLNDDRLVDARDKALFDAVIVRLYDYNCDGVLTREDARLLNEYLRGAPSPHDVLCDVDGDGLLTRADLTRYTALLYNYDLR